MNANPTEQFTQQYLHSLHRNIVLIIISVSVIPLILVSCVIYYQFRAAYREKVYAHLQELIHGHALKVDSYLAEKLGDIRFLADTSDVASLRKPSFMQHRLDILQRDYSRAFVDLGLVAENGRQVAYAGPFQLTNVDYSEAEWFRHAIRREDYISDVFMGIRGQPHFIVAVCISRDSGLWILRATINFTAFNTLVEKIGLGETGFAFIVNQAAELQTTPTVKSLDDMVPSKEIYAGFLSNLPVAPDQARISVKPDRFKRENIYVSTFLKGGEWLLVYQQRLGEAFAELKKTFLITTVLVGVGLMSIMAMAVALSRMIVNRVARADQEKQMLSKRVIEASKLASVGELAAGIAHEINNPVAIMVEEAGWMEDLLDDASAKDSELRTEYKRAIDQIHTQGQRCKEITHKLLSFARKTDTTIEDVDIAELLEEMIAISARRAKYDRVDIRRDIHDNLPPVRLSSAELQQVFFNLINNAMDAMEKSGGTLAIAARKRAADIMVEIADTGEGIPKANLDRIFDPFFTTKAVGKGTGLGLSICYGIIEKIGGSIEVRSAIGAGTTFSVYIPLETGAPARPGGPGGMPGEGNQIGGER